MFMENERRKNKKYSFTTNEEYIKNVHNVNLQRSRRYFLISGKWE